jgi:ABC-type multidrug transport system ATPase subunit
VAATSPPPAFVDAPQDLAAPAAGETAAALIIARGLQRTFEGHPALCGVDLDLRAGTIHALLGPNGAGKTTLLRILTGLATPTGGSLRVLGHDGGGRPTRALAGRVALVPSGTRSFYLRISGLENLVFFGRLHGLRRRAAEARARAVLADVGLTAAADQRTGTYSQGMQRRLAVARALMTRPEVLLVDEATHDLDPEGADAVRRLIADAAAQGAAVLWATQRVEEIRGFADAVTFLDRGRVRLAGSVADLIDRAPAGRYVLEVRDARLLPVAAAEVARAAGGSAHVLAAPGAAHVLVEPRAGVALGSVIASLAAAGHDVLACRRERSEIEEAFLAVVGAEDTP